MALLEAKGIVKKFGDLEVLKGIDFSVERGEFVSIVGASGSGKSTLLTILGGIDKPTEGTVTLDGELISSYSERQLAVLRRTKLGFVFQFFNLAPYLTVSENIMLPIVLSAKSVRDYADKARELTDYLGITPLGNKMPSQLSGGEQQRAAIARGLIFDPELILLDEPTGNLDSKASREIMELLRDINARRGTTIIQVTHSEMNAAYAGRIITMKDGRITESTDGTDGENPPTSQAEEGQA